MFYTYLWLRYDGTPYYVGKGCGNRAFRPYQRTTPPPSDPIRVLVEFHPTEDDAFEAEKFLISFYGRQDLGTGILRNRTDGGEGISGLVFTEEHRRRISDYAKKRIPTEIFRQKLRARMRGNTLWKTRTPEALEKMRQAAITQWMNRADRTQSIETKRRRSEAITKWWIARKKTSSGEIIV